MIVSVDFDNTITESTNGVDILKEIPRIRSSVVAHVNRLKESGHYIKVVTARGCLSCNNDMQKRIAKYYDRIKYILDVNGVPYDELSFNKEYAEVYLDDSCSNIIYEDYEMFHNPNSKNSVIRYGNMIVKEGPTVKEEWAWFEKNKKFNIPSDMYFNPTRNILYMKYIKPTQPTLFSYASVLRTAMNCRKSPDTPQVRRKFLDFLGDTINRSKLEINNALQISLNDLCAECLSTMASSYSEESHGDLTTANIIDDGNDVYVIDPVAPEGQYRGVWLDLGKFRFSLDKHFFPTSPAITMESCLKKANYNISREEMKAIRFCTIISFIRLSKYRSSPEDLQYIGERVWELINEKDKELFAQKED